MAHFIRQKLPTPPPVYDQAYIAKLAALVNLYMTERENAGELISPRFIMTDPPSIGAPSEVPAPELNSTAGLPTGTVYLKKVAGQETNGAAPRFLTVVTEIDPK